MIKQISRGVLLLFRYRLKPIKPDVNDNMEINVHVIISLILKVTAIKEIRFPCLLVMQVEQRRIMVIMYTIPDANV